MYSTDYRPFLVADRPASLRMIRGATLEAFNPPCGIMTHANVSSTVKDFVKAFPSSDGFYPHDTTDERKQEYEDEGKYVAKGDDGRLTDLGQRIRESTVRICDSGVFTEGGSDFSDYADLYEEYEYMDVDYGIMIDELNDTSATIAAAREAIAEYEKETYSFNLIGVAQGTDITEYLSCYDELREIGFEYIAIGGLLQAEGDRSGAFASVSKDEYMERILRSIREEYPNDWLFALGCHHPTRRELFEDLDLFGSDYKGWIYKYTSENGRGTVEARNWRYRNIRSFIRNNILTDIWLPPKPELSIEDRSPGTLLVIVPPEGEQVISSESGTIIQRLDEEACSVYREYSAAQLMDADLTALVWTKETGLVPEDFRPCESGTSARTLVSDHASEELKLDMKKFLQYRSFENVFLIGKGDQLAILRQQLPDICDATTSIRVINGDQSERASQLRELLVTTKSSTSG